MICRFVDGTPKVLTGGDVRGKVVSESVFVTLQDLLDRVDVRSYLVLECGVALLPDLMDRTIKLGQSSGVRLERGLPSVFDDPLRLLSRRPDAGLERLVEIRFNGLVNDLLKFTGPDRLQRVEFDRAGAAPTLERSFALIRVLDRRAWQWSRKGAWAISGQSLHESGSRAFAFSSAFRMRSNNAGAILAAPSLRTPG